MTLVGLLGEGIMRSLTPPMHRREAEHLGLGYEYRIIDIAERGDQIDDLPRIAAEVVEAGFDALNVTHPFKQRIIPLLDELSPAAERLAAVNLVIYREGRTIGHNTDWTGFRRAVEQGLGDVAADRVVQVGAGGAGAATAYALLDLGVRDLVVADVTAARADELADRHRATFGNDTIRAVALADLAGELVRATGVVNATPTGMALSPGVPIDVGLLQPSAWVADVVYLPLATELLQVARAAGHRVLDGGRMAVGQAVDSIRLITGVEPDETRMRAHFLDLVSGAPVGRSDP